MIDRRNKHYPKARVIVTNCQMHYNTCQLGYTPDYLEGCTMLMTIKEMNDHPIEGDGLHVRCDLKGKTLSVIITLDTCLK